MKRKNGREAANSFHLWMKWLKGPTTTNNPTTNKSNDFEFDLWLLLWWVCWLIDERRYYNSKRVYPILNWYDNTVKISIEFLLALSRRSLSFLFLIEEWVYEWIQLNENGREAMEAAWTAQHIHSLFSLFMKENKPSIKAKWSYWLIGFVSFFLLFQLWVIGQRPICAAGNPFRNSFQLLHSFLLCFNQLMKREWIKLID